MDAKGSKYWGDFIYLAKFFFLGLPFVASLAQHQIPMQHTRIYRAWMPFEIFPSKRRNQRDGFWLVRMNLPTHFDRSKTVGFSFSSRASSGPFRWIFHRTVRGEAWFFRPFCCEVWKRSHAIFRGKIAPALEPFENKDSSLVLLLLGTVNGELKLLQNRSKNRFCGERTTTYHS